MTGFIFGGNTGVSYEELTRRREIAAAMQAANAGRAPQSFGEGLTAVGRALAGRMMDARNAKSEAILRDQFDTQMNGILGSYGMGSGGYSAPASYGAPTQPSARGGTSPATAPLGDMQGGYSPLPITGAIDGVDDGLLGMLGQAWGYALPGGRIEVTTGVSSHSPTNHAPGHATDFRVIRPDGSTVMQGDPEMTNAALIGRAMGVHGIGFGPEYMGGSHAHWDVSRNGFRTWGDDDGGASDLLGAGSAEIAGRISSMTGRPVEEVLAELGIALANPEAAAAGAVSPEVAAAVPEAMAAAGPEIATRAATAPTGGGVARQVRDGLIRRGMPEHIADAFVLNFQDESGMDPGAIEAVPNVHGTRGFGLYQPTGSRRIAYEAFARERGTDPSDIDTQLDFMMGELKGPESRAAQEIFAAPDTGTAAAAIVSRFLRPAEEHRARRAAAYMGGAMPSYDGPAVATRGPSAPMGGAPAQRVGGDPMARIAALMPLVSNPMASDGQRMVLSALLQREMNAAFPGPQDPWAGVQEMGGRFYRMGPDGVPMAISPEAAPDLPPAMVTLQARAEAAGLQPGTPEYQSFMLNGGPAPAQQAPSTVQTLQFQAEQAGLQPGTPEYQSFMLNGGPAPRPDQTTGQRNYEYLLEMGVPQEQALQQAFGAGGVNVTTNVGGSEAFDDAFARQDAQTLADLSNAGIAAQRNMGRLDQLDALLASAPSGGIARLTQLAGEWGIETDGLSEIQALQALVNSMVPEQRPPGSGPMSDADLALFIQSLPRVINTPGGNEMILSTLRAVAQYDADGAAVIQQLRAGELTRAQAFDELRARQNPLAGVQDFGARQQAPAQPEQQAVAPQQNAGSIPDRARTNPSLTSAAERFGLTVEELWDNLSPEARATIMQGGN